MNEYRFSDAIFPFLPVSSHISQIPFLHYFVYAFLPTSRSSMFSLSWRFSVDNLFRNQSFEHSLYMIVLHELFVFYFTHYRMHYLNNFPDSFIRYSFKSLPFRGASLEIHLCSFQHLFRCLFNWPYFTAACDYTFYYDVIC